MAYLLWQLLENLVTVTDFKMPLAQNYIDDVSLVESEASLTKTTMDCINTESSIQQGSHIDKNVSWWLIFIFV